MCLGVTGRSRTGTSGFTAHGSAIELRPHPSARLSGLGGRSRTCGLVIPNHARCPLRHTELNCTGSTTWLCSAGRSHAGRCAATGRRPRVLPAQPRTSWRTARRPANCAIGELNRTRRSDCSLRSAFGPLLRNVLAGMPARANGCGLSSTALQAADFDHLATSRWTGAGPRVRTANLRLWRPLLCQLS